jgi:hypothetical protein
MPGASKTKSDDVASAMVAVNDLKDIISGTVEQVIPALEQTNRLLLTVYGTANHAGSAARLIFVKRVDGSNAVYYEVRLECTSSYGPVSESSFIVSLLMPPEAMNDRVEVTEIRVIGQVVDVSKTGIAPRTVVKPIPLPRPR